MKFLCERCMAKYQIPDERVAGKTLRMVCRKCAHVIEVRAPEEWFASVDGDAAGPMPVAELRQRARDGALDESTLVWRDGWDQWRPVRAVPALLAMVREATAKGARIATPARSTPATRRADATPPTPSRAPRPTAPARSHAIATTARLATAEKLDVAPLTREAEREAAPEAPPAPAIAEPPRAAPPIAAPAPIILRQEGPPAYLAIGVILGFVSFGAVAGYATFFPRTQAAPAQTVYVPVPAPPIPSATIAPTTPTAPPLVVPSIPKPAPRGHAKPAPTEAPAAKPLDLGPLLPTPPPLNGLDGPQLQNDHPAPTAGSLSQRQVEEAQHRYMLAMRKACIERGASTAGNANVRARFVVNGSGQVTDVSATGSDPATTACVANELKKWQFPATGGATPVDMPFHFVRQ